MSSVVPLPRRIPGVPPHIVAMVHVPSTTAILGHSYSGLLGVPLPSPTELLAVNAIVKGLAAVLEMLKGAFPAVNQVADIPLKLRSLAFLLLAGDAAASATLASLLPAGSWQSCCEETARHVASFENLPFVQYLVNRAVHEVTVFARHGIQVIEIENVAAPYFVGMGSCPLEELLALFVVSRAVRIKFPCMSIGVHVLSCNELEALPVALALGGSFIRSEATLFGGMRPEGPTDNHGNLARFFYLRHVLRGLLLPTTLETQPWLACGDVYPKIWSDVQKKHTVFPAELGSLDTWLHNITFMKLEGVIVTGAETGSDVDESSLAAARKAVDDVTQWNSKTFGSSFTTEEEEKKKTRGGGPWIPVVTGSGLAFEMYRKYADFMIIGTALKVGRYWENEVDEENVRQVTAHAAT
jgi:predicted TIM-barrel enzyme